MQTDTIAGSGVWRRARWAIGLMLVSGLSACFWSNSVTSRDLSGFETYTFGHRPGLGFCANPDALFSAQVTRAADGTMTLASEGLALAGPDPEDCEDGVPDQRGSFMPEPLGKRSLSGAEVADVTAVFTKVSFHKNPDPICRELGIDPCVIRTHVWDDLGLSDFICGSNRVSVDQAKALAGLLGRLASGP